MDILERFPSIKRVCMEFGVVGHFKGEWDGQFGIQSGMLKRVAWKKAVKALEQLVAIYTQWVEAQHRLHPSGPRYYFELYSPKPKESYNFTALTAGSLGGLQYSMSFSFFRKDIRRVGLLGTGSNWNIFTGVTYRNHGLAGLRELDIKDSAIVGVRVLDSGAVFASMLFLIWEVWDLTFEEI